MADRQSFNSTYSDVQNGLSQAWLSYLENLEKAIEDVRASIKETAAMQSACTAEWCTATEHLIDELHNAIFSIHEPRFLPQEESKRLKVLRKEIRELYADYSAAPKA